jgi:hypothetical protein
MPAHHAKRSDALGRRRRIGRRIGGHGGAGSDLGRGLPKVPAAEVIELGSNRQIGRAGIEPATR